MQGPGLAPAAPPQDHHHGAGVRRGAPGPECGLVPMGLAEPLLNIVGFQKGSGLSPMGQELQA